jgi:hypothetical protein
MLTPLVVELPLHLTPATRDTFCDTQDYGKMTTPGLVRASLVAVPPKPEPRR